MELNRRGFFFSLISLLLLMGLFFLAQPRAYETTLERERASQERIVFTNSIIQNFERGYLSRAIESQTYIVLEALSGYRSGSGLFDDRAALEAEFTEGLVNGTFGSGAETVESNLPADLQNAQRNLIELLDAYANASDKNYNIRFEFSDDPNDYTVRLFQDGTTGPWQVGVDLSLSYNVSPGLTNNGLEIANWTLERSVTSYANIRGVRDPYLYIRTEGNITSPISEFYTQRWSRNVFELFVAEGTYVPYNGSMSLLGRYYDSLEYAECCGLLTTIDETRYDAWNDPLVADTEFANVSFTDCGYFPGSAVTASCRADMGSLVYGVDGITEYTGTLGANNEIQNVNSDFPFTIPGRIATEFFNLSTDGDLYDTYDVIAGP